MGAVKVNAASPYVFVTAAKLERATTAFATEKVWVAVADAQVVFPAWLAVIVQVPGPTKATVGVLFILYVQTLEGLALYPIVKVPPVALVVAAGL